MGSSWGFSMPMSARKALISEGRSAREAIDHLVPWEQLFAPRSRRRRRHRTQLKEQRLAGATFRRHPGCSGRLVRQAPQQLCCATSRREYQVRDRLSFSRFLGLAIEDSIPDATTLVAVPREAGQGRADRDSCSTASTSILRPRATWRVAGRSSTPVSCWCRRSGTVVKAVPPTGGSLLPPAHTRSRRQAVPVHVKSASAFADFDTRSSGVAPFKSRATRAESCGRQHVA